MYELNLLEAKNHCLEEEVKHAELHRWMQEVQKEEKESEIKVEIEIEIKIKINIAQLHLSELIQA